MSVVAKGKDVVDECPVINGTSSIAQRYNNIIFIT